MAIHLGDESLLYQKLRARSFDEAGLAMIPGICAIRRSDPIAADALLAEAVSLARTRGLRLAGVVQRDEQRAGRRRCDMDLIDLSSGRIIRISEDRGNEARGCRMDASALTEAAALVEETIRTGAPDLVILNKFAKAEEEGGGMRDAIAVAISRDIPVLIGVGLLAVPALEAFAGEFCTIIEPDRAAMRAWLDAHSRGRASERLEILSIGG
ncbi:MAG: DUF2478 domain-containing protein [Xanthobacteraceae bacterium]|nr:DUF2478 domain-containing protein [Xanthobacteraceae bacterium]